MNDGSTKEAFHQFHLGLLAAGETDKAKSDLLVADATIIAGELHEQKIGHDVAKELARAKEISCVGYHPSERLCRAWVFGKDIVNWSWHNSPGYCIDQHKVGQEFLKSFGPSPFVRVNWQVVQEFAMGEFEPRDFYVLCAVYAVLGDKRYAIVHRDRVRAGALGYSSAHSLFDDDGNITEAGEALLAKRPDKARPLTINQVRYTLSRLHARKFFSRLQPFPNGRTVYYSRSLSHDQLADALLKRVARKVELATAGGTAEQKFREKAAALLKRLNPGEKAADPSQKSPGSHRSVTAGVTASVTAGVTALIYAPSNSCLPNSFPLNECASNSAGAAQAVSDKEGEEMNQQRKAESEAFRKATLEAIEHGD